MHRVLVVTGPTAIGKTRIALSIARILNGEIISADSTQVYKGLDIGTDKVPSHLQKRVPHHLIDILPTNGEPYNAAQFTLNAKEKCRDIVSRGKTPIIVGGTAFYLRMLRNGLPGTPATDPSVEAQIELELLREGSWEVSFARLATLDPEYAARLNRNDWHRLKRALAIIQSTGRKVSSFTLDPSGEDAKAGRSDSEFNWRCAFLSASRVDIMRRIDTRCEQIIHRGLVEETIGLMARGVTSDSHVGKFVGYRQAIDYVQDEWFRNRTYTRQSRSRVFFKFLAAYQAATRQLHRRQVTWFRAEPEFNWFPRSFFEDDEENKEHEEDVAKDIAAYFQSDAPSNNAQLEMTKTEKEEIKDMNRELRDYESEMQIFTTSEVVTEKIESIEKALIKHRDAFSNPILNIVLDNEEAERKWRERGSTSEEDDSAGKSTRHLRWEMNMRRAVKQKKFQTIKRMEGLRRLQLEGASDSSTESRE